MNRTSVGPYEIVRPLGAGGMGEVFVAHDTRLDRRVALKMLPRELARDPDKLELLRHEARTASSLNHVNIVTIYEIDEAEGGETFIVMELVEGRSLRAILEDGPMPVRDALSLASQIAAGLAAAHEKGVVHRDLKPENVMVTPEGTVKLLDFGLARTMAPPAEESDETAEYSPVSAPGVVVGTFRYMAPETARGHVSDHRGDQFAFGAILYEMLTGQKAFDGSSPVETMSAVMRDDPRPVRTLRDDVPSPLAWLVERCLSKDPSLRYSSTRDLLLEIATIRDHLTDVIATSPEADHRWSRPSPMILAAAILLFFAAAAAVTLIRRPAIRSEPVSIRHLTWSGHDYSPAVSPNGDLLAFASDRDGRLRIWLKQIPSGHEAPFSEGPDDFPRFDPKGTSVLFQRIDGEVSSLYRQSLIAREPRLLVRDAISGDWSPDGLRIAFTRINRGLDPPRATLWISEADGRNAREIAQIGDESLIHPRWSPDGARIAAIARGRSAQIVVIVEADGSGQRVLARPSRAGQVSSVVWSDDARIVYLRSESVEHVVGSTAEIIVHDIDSDASSVIAWSPDSALVTTRLSDGAIAFDARSPRANLRSVQAGERGIGTPLTRGSASDRQPRFSPDGRWIAFTSNRSGNLDIWLLSPESGVVRRVTEDAAEDWDPAWMPDGESIVWSSARSGHHEIWMARLDGSDARQISADGVDAENPTVTPDGRYVVYNSFHPEKRGIWRTDLVSGEQSRLVAGPTALPEVSPDGRHVAYLLNRPGGGLRVMTIDGRATDFTIPIAQPTRATTILGRSRWIDDGRSIAWIDRDENGTTGILAQPFAPGRDTSAGRRAIAGFDASFSTESFDVAPDGSSVVLTAWEQLYSIMEAKGLSLTRR